MFGQREKSVASNAPRGARVLWWWWVIAEVVAVTTALERSSRKRTDFLHSQRAPSQRVRFSVGSGLRAAGRQELAKPCTLFMFFFFFFFSSSLHTRAARVPRLSVTEWDKG